MEMNWTLVRRHGTLQLRAALIQEIRRFFIAGGYLEVETPLRIPAPAPESHIDAITSGEWFLQTSPELCMKRLLAAGYERIFQICRCWREGERGSLHLPEFTMLEWYRAGTDYLGLMDECEALIRSLAQGIIVYQSRSINLAAPWERLTVREAFTRYCRVSLEAALAEGMFDEMMVTEIEPHLGGDRPTFIYDYPASCGALARLSPHDPSVAERFELYIGGLELANAFSELTDPVEQRKRFVLEAEYRASLNKQNYPVPENFLRELSLMPPAAGIALGIDRLIMILADSPTIDGVIAFSPEEL